MVAHSHLKHLLEQQRVSIPELQRKMRSQGLEVSVKSLYRLQNDRHPVERLDMRVAGAICQVCAVPLSAWIVFEAETPALHRLISEKQSRLDALMARSNAGSLTPTEREELAHLVQEAEEITLANARLLTRQRLRVQTLPVGTPDAP